MSPKLSAMALLSLGLVASLSAPQQARAQAKPVLTTLYRFTGALGTPGYGPLAVGSDGTLYGTLGGYYTNTDYGSVFSFNPATRAYKTVLTFSDATTVYNGDTLESPKYLTFSPADGVLYGAATNDSSDDNTGATFRLSTSGALTVLHKFSGYPDDDVRNQDGTNPLAPPLVASDGNLYGTAYGTGPKGGGTLYKITPAGVFSVVWSFDQSLTHYPGALTEGPDGALYGAAATGLGKSGDGNIYKVTKSGVLSRLHTLKADGSEGADAYLPLVVGPDGALYGAAAYGGIVDNAYPSGYGTIFKVTSGGTFTLLHKFSNDGHGGGPSGLTLGPDGNFYGTTEIGGTAFAGATKGGGTVFKMTPAGAVTTLYKFHTTSSGYAPSGMVFGKDGALYGVTFGGGDTSSNSQGYGTIFKLTLP